MLEKSIFEGFEVKGTKVVDGLCRVLYLSFLDPFIHFDVFLLFFAWFAVF